jgi:hypothetical protein
MEDGFGAEFRVVVVPARYITEPETLIRLFEAGEQKPPSKSRSRLRRSRLYTCAQESTLLTLTLRASIQQSMTISNTR